MSKGNDFLIIFLFVSFYILLISILLLKFIIMR